MTAPYDKRIWRFFCIEQGHCFKGTKQVSFLGEGQMYGARVQVLKPNPVISKREPCSLLPEVVRRAVPRCLPRIEKSQDLKLNFQFLSLMKMKVEKPEFQECHLRQPIKNESSICRYRFLIESVAKLVPVDVVFRHHIVECRSERAYQ